MWWKRKTQLDRIEGKVDKMDLDITKLQAFADANKAKVEALLASQAKAVTLLQALSAAAGQGGSVTQAQIDAVAAELSATSDEASAGEAALDAEVAKDTPPAPAG
jgi:septation ring formation regulator EzrA